MVLGLSKRFILSKFRHHNVAVEGAKRTGKGVFISWVIRKRKAPHYSLTPWYVGTKYDTIVKPITFFTVAPNTFENFMTGKVIQLPKNEFLENVDVYIDEANTVLPSSEYKYLDSNPNFKGLSQYQAYSGHIHNANVHIIGQCYSKIYDKVRIHCDCYFRTLNTVHIKRIFITKMMYYEREEAFNEHKLPFPTNLFTNKQAKALKQQYDATTGTIKSFWLIQRMPKNSYDTRQMHQVLYGVKAPKSTKKS